MEQHDPDLMPDSLSSVFAECFAFAATAAQTRPVPSTGAAIECFLGCLSGSALPPPAPVSHNPSCAQQIGGGGQTRKMNAVSHPMSPKL